MYWRIGCSGFAILFQNLSRAPLNILLYTIVKLINDTVSPLGHISVIFESNFSFKNAFENVSQTAAIFSGFNVLTLVMFNLSEQTWQYMCSLVIVIKNHYYSVFNDSWWYNTVRECVQLSIRSMNKPINEFFKTLRLSLTGLYISCRLCH